MASIPCLRDLLAHSSSVSAASSLPWQRYKDPRLLRVVFTVGLSTLQALYQLPYSTYGPESLRLSLLSCRSSACIQIGLLSLLTDPNSFSCALVRISLYRASACSNFPCFR